VDFVLPRDRDAVDIIECKWSLDAVETRSLTVFRANYPKGRNYVLSPQVTSRYSRRQGTLELTYLPLADLRAELSDPE
jgi:hypothetical protein